MTKTLKLGDFHLTEEDLLVTRVSKRAEVLSHPLVSILLETQVTEALQQEGLAREFVSHVQKERKEKNFHVADRIHVEVKTTEVLIKAITNHKNYIMGEILAVDLKTLPITPQDAFVECENEKMNLTLTKV